MQKGSWEILSQKQYWILESGHLGSSLASATHHLEKLLSLDESQPLVSKIAMMIGLRLWLFWSWITVMYIQCLECYAQHLIHAQKNGSHHYLCLLKAALTLDYEISCPKKMVPEMRDICIELTPKVTFHVGGNLAAHLWTIFQYHLWIQDTLHEEKSNSQLHQELVGDL